MDKVFIPPIKCQGIKTKIVPLILSHVANLKYGRWLEPFMGSGVVGLNVLSKCSLFSDLNPHVINFYLALKHRYITPEIAKGFLEQEGNKLEAVGEDHYYEIRERFNQSGSPLDFLFLSRSCFNGMIRFNSKGKFNVPFCKKPNRFARSYITKIINQIANFQKAINVNCWDFHCQDFEKIIEQANATDLIYCDPPYLGRHVDYFDSWSKNDEFRLFKVLSTTKAKFILSTWHSNQYRTNDSLKSFWGEFYIVTQQHFYHVGAKEQNRVPMLEALITNFPLEQSVKETYSHHYYNPPLFPEVAATL
ncbi:MAG: Dam family site-specific DNA-(adenine-N6)-methyltransferase [Holophagales bacterium]|jgi:DNA adenine methylase|nr:Dam family site-specific DNA-(adenine-N6)-methyltransferase [Holophagales bacterium]